MYLCIYGSKIAKSITFLADHDVFQTVLRGVRLPIILMVKQIYILVPEKKVCLSRACHECLGEP